MNAAVQGRISGYGLALHYQPHRSAEQVAADDYRTRAADATAHARAIEKAKALINARKLFDATDEEKIELAKDAEVPADGLRNLPGFDSAAWEQEWDRAHPASEPSPAPLPPDV